MPDPRVDRLAVVVGRVEGAACWLARLATRAAAAGGAAGLLLWWALTGDRVADWWRGTAGSLVVLGLCLGPSLWLVNVRAALDDLVELPGTLRGVATRRAAQLRAGGEIRRPEGGVLGAVRALRGILRDYGDVAGSWGTVARLAVPAFWVVTVLAFLAVPVLVLVAAVAALVDAVV